ncbi:uncharacterized protein [Prorops nasuta]|uniref:uncharacterized protein isoform X2 n=1 Tax=Prorops nasuta TaxID=863751 RepID=UPI0034CEFA80
MNCCCSPPEPEEKNYKTDVEFLEIYSSGFEKNYKSFVDPEDSEVAEESFGFVNTNERNKNATEVLFVDGNETDVDVCDDEDTLMERVWRLVKPPDIPKRTFVVSARKIQIVKERLSGVLKKLPNTQTLLNERSISKRRKGGLRYNPVLKMNGATKLSCQNETIRTIPTCAQSLSNYLKK